ncbi:MAG: triose-phosphate isomerase [Woeseiaceae bacterium]
MRDILVAGNWKMNGDSAGNSDLVAGILSGAPDSDRVRLLVSPPFPYLAAVAAQISGSSVLLAAQTVSENSAGAFTGEVSVSMLKDMGCTHVLVGHSERRALFGESSADVAAKFKAAIEGGLTPVLCVGETLSERESGSTEAVIDGQLSAVLDAVGIAGFDTAVVAYEPVWAIGTGMTATPEQAQDVHKYIRSTMAAQDADIADATLILYGGSVKGDNAAGLFSMPDIDGGLIGGASLKADDFLAIATAAASI